MTCSDVEQCGQNETVVPTGKRSTTMVEARPTGWRWVGKKPFLESYQSSPVRVNDVATIANAPFGTMNAYVNADVRMLT